MAINTSTKSKAGKAEPATVEAVLPKVSPPESTTPATAPEVNVFALVRAKAAAKHAQMVAENARHKSVMESIALSKATLEAFLQSFASVQVPMSSEDFASCMTRGGFREELCKKLRVEMAYSPGEFFSHERCAVLVRGIMSNILESEDLPEGLLSEDFMVRVCHAGSFAGTFGRSLTGEFVVGSDTYNIERHTKDKILGYVVSRVTSEPVASTSTSTPNEA